jgi:hypothetical protein
MECAVLPNIANTTPPARIDISTWNIPKDFILANETFNVPGKIDLLIGAGVFFEIINPKKRHARAIIQFCKKQLWAASYQVAPQQTCVILNEHFRIDVATIQATISIISYTRIQWSNFPNNQMATLYINAHTRWTPNNRRYLIVYHIQHP